VEGVPALGDIRRPQFPKTMCASLDKRSHGVNCLMRSVAQRRHTSIEGE
jgi:hypothetical protein